MSLDKVFEALASRQRREMLAYLSKIELTTSELTERFAMSAPAVSRHLSILEGAGLVQKCREGQLVRYFLAPNNPINTLSQFALEICPTGGPLKRESRAIARRRVAARAGR